MKVGTDGTLLGAWSQASAGPCRVLDVGTGTGLIALMMAQRYPEALVIAIDIDEKAVFQAQENVSASPFADRIKVLEADVQTFEDSVKFDSIVCNPPFFEDSLVCPDPQRTEARHTVSLGYRQLMESAFRLLKDDGRFSVIIPADCRSRLESEAHLRGFFISRLCSVQTTSKKAPKRYMIEFAKHPVNEIDITNGILESLPQIRSDWYRELTQDFYIK
jgi:tRNA1Val (adenine37-N6)-methyltransferase